MSVKAKILFEKLRALEGKGYKAYKGIKNRYEYLDYSIVIDHVQGDPFAAPSKLRVLMPQEKAGFPESLFSNEIRQTALENLVFRYFEKAILSCKVKVKGAGHSGLVRVAPLGQEVLKRSGIRIDISGIELRFELGLPAMGRRIAGIEACVLFERALPSIIEKALYYKNHEPSKISKWVDAVEDQQVLRESLKEKKIVAFVADGAILPRMSGADDRPLSGQNQQIVPFKSPKELRVGIDTPNGGEVFGMGIPEGVTLIVGGGYHGKSTLLKAIEHSVYNHIPGDGRELVVTRDDAVMIRSEDGRSVAGVKISPFIANLPYGKDTDSFTSQDSSGSTSQAANIIEALEQGSKFLLIDEDTSANNFLIRDGRMQRLVARDKEPIVPFIDRVEKLHLEKGVSTVMVLGGSGDYFEVADNIIMLDQYVPCEVTNEAKRIVQDCDSKRDFMEAPGHVEYCDRIPSKGSFDPMRRGRVKIDVREHELIYGTDKIDLRFVEQLVDPGQLRLIGDFIFHLSERRMNSETSLAELIKNGLDEIEDKGFDVVAQFEGLYPGDYAMPRVYEIAATINRLRTLKVKQKQ
jgi:predicted ABC-class ATPase